MTTYNRDFEHKQSLLLTGMESEWHNIQTASRLIDVSMGIAEYRNSTGLESNPLLLEVADYAIRDTDLTKDDLLTVSAEDTTLGKFVGNLVSGIYKAIMRILTKFSDWVRNQTSEQRSILVSLGKLKEDMKEMVKDPDASSRVIMPSASVRILQIDYKVITETRILVKELTDYCEFTRSMLSGYAEDFLNLVTVLNDSLAKSKVDSDVSGLTLAINKATSTFIKSTDRLVTHSDLNRNARSKMYLGNNNLYRYGATPDIMQRLTTDQPIASELAKIKFAMVNDTKDDIQISGKHELVPFSKVQCTDSLNVAERTAKAIIEYNEGMERNIATQLKNMREGENALAKIEAKEGGTIKVDGKSTLTDINLLRELYRYQTPIWSWGTTPVAKSISTFNMIMRAYTPLIRTAIKQSLKESASV